MIKKNNNDNMLLIKAYKESGCLKAKAELYRDYKPLIIKTVMSFDPNKELIEDLVQEVSIAFLKCLDRFDENNGAFFSVYAQKCLKGAVLDYFRLKLDNADLYCKGELKTDYEFTAIASNNNIIQETIDDELLTLIKQEVSTLNERERHCFSILSEDSTRLSELSKIYGITEEGIRKIYVRSLAKIKSSLAARNICTA
jgi:RNA polymerase sigma factor (sigma-70 family)